MSVAKKSTLKPLKVTMRLPNFSKVQGLRRSYSMFYELYIMYIFYDVCSTLFYL